MSSYSVFVAPDALAVAKRLPGKVRQRVKRSIDGLQSEPRPPDSKELAFPNPAVFPGPDIEVRRIRIDKWRVLYTIREEEKVVDVLALRKRPPYDYGDLHDLLGDPSDFETPENP